MVDIDGVDDVTNGAREELVFENNRRWEVPKTGGHQQEDHPDCGKGGYGGGMNPILPGGGGWWNPMVTLPSGNSVDICPGMYSDWCGRG